LHNEKLVSDFWASYNGSEYRKFSKDNRSNLFEIPKQTVLVDWVIPVEDMGFCKPSRST
jgi:hypothetical protein